MTFPIDFLTKPSGFLKRVCIGSAKCALLLLLSFQGTGGLRAAQGKSGLSKEEERILEPDYRKMISLLEVKKRSDRFFKKVVSQIEREKFTHFIEEQRADLFQKHKKKYNQLIERSKEDVPQKIQSSINSFLSKIKSEEEKKI